MLRERLLLLADRFAALDRVTREMDVHPRSHYRFVCSIGIRHFTQSSTCKTESAFSSFGWFHGKEIMNGNPDTLKGPIILVISSTGP